LSETNSITVDAAADESGSVEICGFSSVNKVTCSVVALNKAGISPLVMHSKHSETKASAFQQLGKFKCLKGKI